MEITIKSFNGIGDLLFVTPTLKVIKEAYPDCHITVNTNYPDLLEDNPNVDVIGSENVGTFLGYDDPIHQKWPTAHHILKDWHIICEEYGLHTDKPALQPELYLNFMTALDVLEKHRSPIGVQIIHKGHWHAKKIWPKFDYLSRLPKFVPIPKVPSIKDLIYFIACCKAVVCAEGGISHIAKAVGTPAIVIYGGFAKPEWNGYEDQINVCNEKWCSYCYNPKPCENEIERICMKEISIEHVCRLAEGLEKIPELEQHNAMKFIKEDALCWSRTCSSHRPDMLDIGAGNNPLRGARGIDTGKDEDAYNIYTADRSQDFIFSSHCIEHLDYPSKALREWSRVLRTGGLLYLYFPSPDYIPWRQKSMPKWHKHDFRIESILAMLPDDLYPIEIAHTDWFFGQKIIARKEK